LIKSSWQPVGDMLNAQRVANMIRIKAV